MGNFFFKFGKIMEINIKSINLGKFNRKIYKIIN